MDNALFNTSPFVPSTGVKPADQQGVPSKAQRNAQHTRDYDAHPGAGFEAVLVISRKGISAIGPVGTQAALHFVSII